MVARGETEESRRLSTHDLIPARNFSQVQSGPNCASDCRASLPATAADRVACSWNEQKTNKTCALKTTIRPLDVSACMHSMRRRRLSPLARRSGRVSLQPGMCSSKKKLVIREGKHGHLDKCRTSVCVASTRFYGLARSGRCCTPHRRHHLSCLAIALAASVDPMSRKVQSGH